MSSVCTSSSLLLSRPCWPVAPSSLTSRALGILNQVSLLLLHSCGLPIVQFKSDTSFHCPSSLKLFPTLNERQSSCRLTGPPASLPTSAFSFLLPQLHWLLVITWTCQACSCLSALVFSPCMATSSYSFQVCAVFSWPSSSSAHLNPQTCHCASFLPGPVYCLAIMSL